MRRDHLLPGDPLKVGNYWVAARLGSGGQGIVYEAYDDSGIRVAVKVLRPEVAGDPDSRGRLLKEAQAVQRVASFCTAKLLRAEADAEQPYLVSEFVAGPSLRARVLQDGPLAGDDVRRLAIAMATALAAIHQAGVVHRDIKPDNVILGPDGPRVIDFGIARTADMTLTATGGLTGTPCYMAPEVLNGGPAGPAADVFAWGATVYFAATARDAFSAETLGEVTRRVGEHQPDLTPLPDPLRALTAAALRKDPDQRPDALRLLHGLVIEGLDTVRDLAADGQNGRGLVVRPSAGVSVSHMPLGTIAEHTYCQLDPAAQAAARSAFLRLIQPGVDPQGRQDSVRAARVEEILDACRPGDSGPARKALDSFTAAGLLTRDGPTVQPTSPALLRAWPRLRDWVRADRDRLRGHRRLGAAALRWESEGRPRSALHQGEQLGQEVKWAAEAPDHLRLTPLEKEFIESSALQQQRRARQRRYLVGVVATLLVFSLTAGVLIWQKSRSNSYRARVIAQQERDMVARNIAARADSLRKFDPRAAMLLNVAAWRVSPVFEARSGLLSAAAQQDADTFTLPRMDIALSRDGSTLLGFTEKGVLRVYDAATHRLRQERRLTKPSGTYPSAALSPAGDALAVSTMEGVRVWNDGGRAAVPGSFGDEDSEVLALGAAGKALVVKDDHHVQVWDVPSRHLLARIPRDYSPDTQVEADLSGTGRLALCAWDGSLELWDITSARRVGRPLVTDTDITECHTGSVRFSDDGSRLAGLVHSGAYALGDVRVWRADTGKQDPAYEGIRFTADRPNAFLVTLAFRRDGKALAVADDRQIQLFEPGGPDTAGAIPRAVYLLQHEGAASLSLADDGRTVRFIRTPDAGPALRSVDLLAGAVVGGASGPAGNTLLSDDGRVLAREVAGRGHITVRVEDPASGRLLGRPITATVRRGTSAGPPEAVPMALSDDGRFLALADPRSGTAGVWDTRARRLLRTIVFVVPFGGVGNRLDSGFLLSGDGSVLVVTSSHDTVEARATATGRLVWASPSGTGAPLALSPDGRRLVTATGAVVDLMTGRTRHVRLAQYDTATQAAFSPDGKMLAASDYAGGLALWDGRLTRKLVALDGDNAYNQGLGTLSMGGMLAFSQDGSTLAVLGPLETSVQLWDLASLRRLGPPLPTAWRWVPFATMALDRKGRHLYSTYEESSDNGVVHKTYLAATPLAPALVARSVCDRVGRDLTAGEWSLYIPELPFRRVCERDKGDN
ncbi:serine/threonine-protein kinase [Streptomyces sp. NPDC005760]|uniref:serine/threonine-protein kinase n=1 Tax=Streptomyces sp. NPDC005760 TaxID=3156718 RepID=UPI0033E15A5B